MRAVRRRLYPNSPMLMPVIGRDKTLNNITHDDLIDYYQTYYAPHNITLVVTGDVDPEEVFALAGEQFGAEDDRETPDTLPPISVYGGSFDVRLRGPMPNDQSQLMVGALLGPGDHEDRFAWWVIEEMMDNALRQDIRYEHGLTYSVNVLTTLYTDTGYFGVYARAKQDDMHYISHAVEKHIDRLVAGDFSTAELEEARTALRGRTILDLQDNLELASWLTYDALHTPDDYVPVADYFAAITDITEDDIQAVAERYLEKSKRFRVRHEPAFTPKQLRPVAVAAVGATTALWSLRRALHQFK